jgi:hypothetical protein
MSSCMSKTSMSGPSPRTARTGSAKSAGAGACALARALCKRSSWTSCRARSPDRQTKPDDSAGFPPAPKTPLTLNQRARGNDGLSWRVAELDPLCATTILRRVSYEFPTFRACGKRTAIRRSQGELRSCEWNKHAQDSRRQCRVLLTWPITVARRPVSTESRIALTNNAVL